MTNKTADKQIKKLHCLRCKKETVPNYRCVCAGAGGGGNEDNDKSEKKSSPAMLTKTTKQPTYSQSLAEEDVKNIFMQLQLRLDQKPFDPELMAHLIAEKLLEIENNADLSTLTLRFIYKVDLLPADAKIALMKFVTELLKELQRFKLENAITKNCAELNTDKDGNWLSLRIMLTPKHFDAFIKTLIQKNLLPTHANQAQKKLAPSPFAPTLRPATVKKKQQQEEEEQKRTPANKKTPEKPSIRPRSPLELIKMR